MILPREETYLRRIPQNISFKCVPFDKTIAEKARRHFTDDFMVLVTNKEFRADLYKYVSKLFVPRNRTVSGIVGGE